MGKTEGRQYATKQKEAEEQLPKHDYKMTQNEHKPFAGKTVTEQSMTFEDYDTLMVY